MSLVKPEMDFAPISVATSPCKCDADRTAEGLATKADVDATRERRSANFMVGAVGILLRRINETMKQRHLAR